MVITDEQMAEHKMKLMHLVWTAIELEINGKMYQFSLPLSPPLCRMMEMCNHSIGNHFSNEYHGRLDCWLPLRYSLFFVLIESARYRWPISSWSSRISHIVYKLTSDVCSIDSSILYLTIHKRPPVSHTNQFQCTRKLMAVFLISIKLTENFRCRHIEVFTSRRVRVLYEFKTNVDAKRKCFNVVPTPSSRIEWALAMWWGHFLLDDFVILSWSASIFCRFAESGYRIFRFDIGTQTKYAVRSNEIIFPKKNEKKKCFDFGVANEYETFRDIDSWLLLFGRRHTIAGVMFQWLFRFLDLIRICSMIIRVK